jgi:nicotinate phosphoribosyltransferase
MAYKLLPYNQSLALLTDLYEVTMAYGYWKSGVAEHEAVFHLIFREHPFKGSYTVACGLAYVIDFLENFRFDESDTKYLATLKGNDGKELFDPKFLEYLRALKFQCDVDAVSEGTAVFPQEPLLRIQGPVLQCQLLETALLNMLNFQTLIATKAARVCAAAKGDHVIEFGLRRAQGFDGGLAASRAAYIGGCGSTSNVLAGKLFGIPVKGTQAHSWVMFHDEEREAFEKYAKAMPNNSIFLVDTYDTLEGVKKAVEAGKWLRDNGHKMVGIRLDSGDLAGLSVKARKMLDEAGFKDAVIVASNELDEHLIEKLKKEGAQINVWGVGTRLVTGFDQPALGGVYKLAATKDEKGEWKRRFKISEEVYKSSDPGIKQVRRFFSDGRAVADVIYDVEKGIGASCSAVGVGGEKEREVKGDGKAGDLLVPVFRKGKLIYELPSLHEARKSTQSNLASLKHPYFVGLEKSLFDLGKKLMAK